jgi:2-polyprenyl-3-methyl-5-hydroxy-6-metoxy-1,4-benzoquinol methylase
VADRDDAAGAEGGNVYDKYATRHPIERRLVGGFLGRVDELVSLTGASEAHEVGCGEGEIAIRLARRGIRVRGSDVVADVIAEARRRGDAAGVEIEFRRASIEELEPGADAAELIVCCEVLEHLADPERGLAVLASLARPWLLVSVPREPLWRALNLARGHYLAELGNTPGHLNHWSRRGFVDWLSARLSVVEVRAPLPWTMALCRA